MTREFTTVTIDEKDSLNFAISNTIDEWCNFNETTQFMKGYLSAIFIESKCYEKLKNLTKKYRYVI